MVPVQSNAQVLYKSLRQDAHCGVQCKNTLCVIRNERVTDRYEQNISGFVTLFFVSPIFPENVN